MPTYEYNCEKCGHFEYFQRITEPALPACPKCEAKVERLVSAAAFHLKGSGWYKTDYSSGSSSAGGDTKSGTTAEPKTTEKATETTSTSASSSSSAPASSGQ